MSVNRPRLPGIGKGVRLRGPLRRRAERVAREARRGDGLDEIGEFAVGLLYYTADELDRLARDPESSSFNMGRHVVNAKDIAQWVAAITATTSAPDSLADLMAAFDESAADVRDTAAT
jgi:hypothetical protein